MTWSLWLPWKFLPNRNWHYSPALTIIFSLLYPNTYNPFPSLSQTSTMPEPPGDPPSQAAYDSARGTTAKTERSHGQQFSQIGLQPASQNSTQTSRANTQDHWSRPRTPERSLPHRSGDHSSPYRSRDRSRERDRSHYSSGHYSREQGSRHRSRSREQEYMSGGRSHPRDFSKDRNRDFRSRSPCDVSPTPYRPDIKCTLCHKIGYRTQDCWHNKRAAAKPALPKQHANIPSSQAAVRQSEVTKLGREEDKQFASKVPQDYQALVTENVDLRSKNSQLQRQVDQLRKKIDQVRNEGDSIIEQQGATLEKLNEQLQIARQ